MIDVSPKTNSLRSACASGILQAPSDIIKRVKDGKVPKGDVLATARAAAISVAKRSAEWMVFCHPIPLDWVDAFFDIQKNTIEVKVKVRTVWKTGVEMEAITGVSGALLNMYDMLKPLTDDLLLSDIRVVSKSGGKSDPAHRVPDGLEAAVLVVSDSTKAGTRVDTSGEAIRDFLEKLGIPCVEKDVVPDDTSAICESLQRLTSGRKARLVITTGGTGIGPRDVTPEATRRIIERELPAVSAAIQSYGQNRVPSAMLSRGTCGVRGQTILVNLPGSEKAVKEGLQALFPGILHAFPMLAGEGHD